MYILLFLLGFFMCLTCVLIYDRHRKPREEQKKLTEEEQRKEQEILEHYQNMVNYDYKQALGGDKHAN